MSITAGCGNISNLSAIGVAVAWLSHCVFSPFSSSCSPVRANRSVPPDRKKQCVCTYYAGGTLIHGHSSNVKSLIGIQEIFGQCHIVRCGIYQNRTDHLDFIVVSYYGHKDAMTHVYIPIYLPTIFFETTGTPGLNMPEYRLLEKT